MGQIRKLRKKYSTPAHPWQRERIVQERELVNTYGLKNKHEIWKLSSKLKKYAKQAKYIIANKNSKQSQKEHKDLIAKLAKYGLISTDAKLEDILVIQPKQLFERRLQTIVFRKGLAHSVKQARQFIVHGHVTIADKKVDVPSYLVKKEEENLISIKATSKLASPEHPERITKEVKEARALKEKTRKEEVAVEKIPTKEEIKEVIEEPITEEETQEEVEENV